MTNSSEAVGVLVGVDGSPASRAALRWAADYAALHEKGLTLVHVLGAATLGSGLSPAPDPLSSTELATWREGEGRRVLAGACRIVHESLPDDQRGRIARRLIWGAPASVLIEWSSRADLVVLGRRSQETFRTALLGSTGAAVSRHAHCPVAVIGDDEPAALARRTTILVGVDGSPASEWATAFAFAEASRRHLQLVALHACTDAEAAELPSMEESCARAFGARLLAERLAGSKTDHPEVVVQPLVADGDPAGQLIAHSAFAQLTVVGRRGRGGFHRMLLGSVSGAVLQAARSPVVVTPQPRRG